MMQFMNPGGRIAPFDEDMNVAQPLPRHPLRLQACDIRQTFIADHVNRMCPGSRPNRKP